jgi:hypothetical protein
MGFKERLLTTGLGAALNPSGYRARGAEADSASPLYSEQRKLGAAESLADKGRAGGSPYQLIQSLWSQAKENYHARTDGTGSAKDTAGRAYIKGYIAELGKDERRNAALQMVVDALRLPKKNAGYIPMSLQARGESIGALQRMMQENRVNNRDQPLEAQYQDKRMAWGSRGFNAMVHGWERPHSVRPWP